MLSEERYDEIVRLIDEKKSVSVAELVKILEASESTVRRCLAKLSAQGRIKKVHGGAMSVSNRFLLKDEDVSLRTNVNIEAKNAIAKYAASLICANDFVYLDAGTTTEAMIDYITGKDVVFVTNGINHGRKLAKAGYVTYILGGEIKRSTECVIGVKAVEELMSYNFTKAFFGTNGVSEDKGFTTPDIREAMVKKRALEKSKEVYVLADSSKFSQIAPVKFGEFKEATIITCDLNDKSLKKYENIKEVKQWYIQLPLIQH